MPEKNLPAPAAVADMAAQAAWQSAHDENIRLVLEYSADTIRALMARCVALSQSLEQSELPSEDDHPTTVAWEFDLAEGEVLAGPDTAVAETNHDHAPDGVGDFRTLTVPCVTWFGFDRDAVEVRAFARWLLQAANWLEGTK